MSRIMSISTYEKDSNNNSILVNHPIGTTTSQIDYINSQGQVSGNLTDGMISMDNRIGSIWYKCARLESRSYDPTNEWVYTDNSVNPAETRIFTLYRKDNTFEDSYDSAENLFFYTIQIINGHHRVGVGSYERFDFPNTGEPYLLERLHAQAPCNEFRGHLDGMDAQGSYDPATVRFQRNSFNVEIILPHDGNFFGSGWYIGNKSYPVSST